MAITKLDTKGAALVSVIIILPFLILIALIYTQLATNNYIVAKKEQLTTKTQLTADAGIDYGMKRLSQDVNWPGTGPDPTTDTEIVFDTADNIKKTFELRITDVSSNRKILTSIARLYIPASSTAPDSTLTLDAELRPVSAGNFSIVTGVGGLIMENSAKVLGGSVFVNGTVSMKNTAQIGLTTSPINLQVAHQACPNPPDATYPRVCNSGESGQPISIQNSARIYGSVTANNQTSGTGMSNPGLIGSSGVSPQALPIHDRNAQKAAATNNLTAAAASCTQNNGTKTWPANTKITGNVTIEKSCQVTIQGNVWITGTLSMVNSGQIIVSNVVGSTKPNIMVDGSTVSLNNTSQIVNNASGTGVQIISYYSTASCSPDCANVTGNDLKNSRDWASITLDNSAAGPATVFYARWTKVQINNSGQIGALIGQTVYLKNTGTITFGTTVGTGTFFWVLDNYKRGG